MKASKILYEAAEHVANTLDGATYKFGGISVHQRGVCGILCNLNAPAQDRRRAYTYIESIFDNDRPYWFGLPYTDRGAGVNIPNQEHRLMSVLMTAAIAESIGD